MYRYTRVFAWLHTVAEKAEKTRYERYIEDGVTIVPPEVKCLYLFEYLMQIGAAFNNGMTTVPMSWIDLNAWMQVTGVPLNAWEAKVIHKASEVYVNQLGLSRKPDCPMPERIVNHDPKKLAKHIKSILR